MNSQESLYIKKLVYGGYGLAQKEGKAVLVDYALPGEVVEIQTLQEKKDYLLARTKRVILQSSLRREPPCPYFGVCGGCQLQHMEYTAQLRSKEEILLETLNRIGKLELKRLEPSLFSEEFGYRVRVQFKVSEGKLGFFERRSHNIVEIKECPVAHPAINDLIPSLKELAKKVDGLREIHVFCSPHEDEFLIKLLLEKPFPKEKLKKLIDNLLPKKTVGVGVYTENRLYHLGRDFTFVKVGPYKYRTSMDSFIQVNHFLWESFVNSAVPKERYNKVLELHCGIGFFSLFLAESSDFVLAYDTNRSAIKDAEYNAKINSVSNVSFQHESGFEALKKHAGEPIDLLFLDPPRSGLSEGEAKLILKNKPKEVVYVSCEPTTLARDLKVLVKGGYNLISVRMVDNFPNTYHIEAIAYLRLE
ncbi:MAG: class I SAM-dependent RNA methyltransferase [Aquificaceae bacterium]